MVLEGDKQKERELELEDEMEMYDDESEVEDDEDGEGEREFVEDSDDESVGDLEDYSGSEVGSLVSI